MAGAGVGAKNAYYCETCGRYTITVHVDEGVTPMFLACRASVDLAGCSGTARSMMYRPEPWPDHVPKEPGWEWYRPSSSAIRRRDPAVRDHLERGGLELRKIGGEAPAGPKIPRKERRARERAEKKGRKA